MLLPETNILRKELEDYRVARHIQNNIEDKHRCLCLEYKDSLGFHMDIVPCVPTADIQRASLRTAMLKYNLNIEVVVDQITGNAVYITDDRIPDFNRICSDWLVSNMEGYALWFETRIRLDNTFVFNTALKSETRIDDVPQFIRKRPLQKVIQLLKRHRDVMFKGKEELKPVSIILTTLAAQAYLGEISIADAVDGILNRIENGVRQSGKKVPNPVNPEEDFADKWAMPQYKKLKLEENFHKWVIQAKADFKNLTNQNNLDIVYQIAKVRFDVSLDQSEDQLLKACTYLKPLRKTTP